MGENRMRETAHKQSRFLNCLRIAIVPEHYEEQRIQSIVEFCEKYAFDNVMLFINAEEYNLGHMTLEEARPWLAAMKRAKAIFEAAGITVSLNPWIEIGHIDRGRKLREGQDFVTMCDYNGTKCEMVTCPMDENWFAYYSEFYEFLIRELEPETVWVEDDFRLHNHGGLEYGGCFCEHHMKAFNEKLGTAYTRGEFVDRLFRKNPDDKVKQAFMEVNRECMANLAEKIGELVHNIGLGTKVGLMSSMHQYHSMEYRDWEQIHKGLAQGGPMINRLHLPMYMEDKSMKMYYLLFNYFSFVCRGYLPKGCHVLPELENGAFNVFSKDDEALRFQVESAIPLEIEGMTYDIFDFVGNGVIEEYGYGQAIGGITDYMTAVWESGYSYHDLAGVTILLDEKNAYNRPIRNRLLDMLPDEFSFGAILQTHGISARCSKEKEFHDEVIVLAAGSIYNFTDEQLCKLFADNHIIMEGRAAELLIDRGLGDLIGATGYKHYIAHVDNVSYEQVEGDALILGVPGCRATAFSRTGDYVSISYENKPEVRSRVYSSFDGELGYGIVEVNGHLIVPYVIASPDLYDQMHPLRATFICNYIDSLKKDFVRADYSSIYAYYSKAEKNVLILVNPTHSTRPATRFKMTGSTPSKVYEITHDGRQEEKRFHIDAEEFVVIDEVFTALTTKSFVIEI